MKLKLTLFFTAILFSSSLFAQGAFDEGMKSFLNNDRQAAINSFKEAITDGDNVAESHLALSFVYTAVQKGALSFSHFDQFVKLVDNPYPYIIALFSSGDVGLGGSEKNEVQLAFFENLLNDPNIPGKLKAMCYQEIGDHYLSKGDFKKAYSYYAQVGSIDVWSSVGPFENISAGGYNKNYGALEHPEATHSFRSRYGAKIKWFDVYGPRHDKWLDNEYFFSTGNALIYSQTFVRSPKTQKVQFRLGVSGSVKMWLNDKLIFEEKDERNNNLDSYIIETELEKGNNRILIQIGESEVNSSNHMLRITDDAGYPIPDLTASAFGSNYSDATPPSKILEVYEEAFFEKQIAIKSSLLGKVLLSTAYLRNDKKYLARKVLNSAIEDAPNSSFLKLNLASIYIREDNRTGLAILVKWLKENDLESPVSMGLTFKEALKNEEYELADSILYLYQDQFGNNATYYDYAIDIAIAKDENEVLIGLINDAYAKFRDVEQFVNLKAIVEQSVNKNTAKAIKIRKKYLKKHYDWGVSKSLASSYFKANNVAAGLSIYNNQVENYPYSVGTFYEISNFHMAMRNYSTALSYIEKCIALAPYQDDYWGTKGEILEEMDEFTDAQEAYERAIELYPNNYDVREKLRLLNDEKSVFSLFEDEDYYEIFKNSPSKDEFPDDNSLIVRYETQKVVYEGGGSEEKVILLVKVFNSAGIDDWKEYSIPIYNFQRGVVEKVEVIKANGSKLEAERSGTRVVFTNLEPGDGILIIYRVKNHYFGKLAFNFWEQHSFTLSYPYLHNSYSLLISPKLKFNHKFSNGGIEPVKSREGEFDLYVWSKSNQAATRSENYMSRYVDFGETLFLSTFQDWSEISHWYSDLAATKSKPDFEVKELVAKLLEGKEGLSEREKVEIIYNYIVKNIRYSSVSFRQSGLIPQKASDVLNTKIGDCKDVSTLFVSMCKEAGVKDVGLVLVNTRDNGRKDLSLPSISFNHCIARVNLDGEDYYVELTSENNSFLTYGDNLINSYALEIYDESEGKKSEAFYFNPKNRNQNSVIRTTEVNVNGNDLDMKTDNIKTGNWASYMRYRYKDESADEQRKVMLNALNSDYKNVDLDKLEFSPFDTLTNDYSYMYSFKIKNAITKIAGLNIFTIPWNDSYESSEFVSDENRKYPLELWRFFNYDKKVETITISLPSGKTLAERPKNVYIDNEFATYSIKYSIRGNSITATRELIPKKQVVEPAEFNKLKEFISTIIEHDTKSLAYK